MGYQLKISGVYNLETINKLSTENIQNLGFDFRPTSFNFLQRYGLLEIIETCFDAKIKYFLHYCDEKEFMIKETLVELKNSLQKNINSKELLNVLESNFFLEFSDQLSFEYYDQFKQPFFLHYYPKLILKQNFTSFFFHGLIVDYKYIEQAHEQGSLSIFLNNLKQIVKSSSNGNMLQIILLIDWDSNLIPSLSDVIDFKYIDLTINSKIEKSYRNVDIIKLKHHIQLIQKIFMY